MTDHVLKEYIGRVLAEELYHASWQPPKKKSHGILAKLKSIFAGNSFADEVVEDWIDTQETVYDVDFTDGMFNVVRDFARTKAKPILHRARDKAHAEARLRRALSAKFTPQLRELQMMMRRAEEDEDTYED